MGTGLVRTCSGLVLQPMTDKHILLRAQKLSVYWKRSLISWFVSCGAFSVDQFLVLFDATSIVGLLIRTAAVIGIAYSAYCLYLGTAIRGVIAIYSDYVTWHERPMDERGKISAVIGLLSIIFLISKVIFGLGFSATSVWLILSGYSVSFLRYLHQAQNYAKYGWLKRKYLDKDTEKLLRNLEPVLHIDVVSSDQNEHNQTQG